MRGSLARIGCARGCQDWAVPGGLGHPEGAGDTDVTGEGQALPSQ